MDCGIISVQAVADGFVRPGFALVRLAEACYTPVVEKQTNVRNVPEGFTIHQAIRVFCGNQMVHRKEVVTARRTGS